MSKNCTFELEEELKETQLSRIDGSAHSKGYWNSTPKIGFSYVRRTADEDSLALGLDPDW